MPGHVVYFLDMAKRKGSRKSCPLLNIYLHFARSDDRL
nr:MAG TPA: hypothetical protein [Caudoviricetes sp.]